MLGKTIEYLLSIIQEFYTIEDLEVLCNKIVETVSSNLKAKRVSLMLLSEGNKLKIVAYKGISEKIVKNTEVELGKQISGKALKEKKVFFIKNISEFKKKYNFRKKRGIKSDHLIVIPLYIGDKLIGTLNITDIEGKFNFKERDEIILKALASHIALAIERIKLMEFQNIKMQQAITLFEISKTLNSFINIDDTLNSFIDILATLLGISEIAIYIFQKNVRIFKLKKSVNITEETEEKISEILHENKDYFLNYTQGYDSFIVNDEKAYFFPLKYEKETIGELVIFKKGECMHDIKFLSILASQVAVILGKEILLERLKIEKEKFRNLNVISKKLTMVFEVSKLNDVLEEELKSIFDYDIFALMVFKSDLSGANLFFGLNGEKAKYLIKDSYDMITNLLKIHIKNFDESAINIKGIDEFDLNMFSKNIGLKSHLIMPLIENDKILGIFFIGSSDSNAITVEDDIEIFSVIGNYVETTLRKIMLFKENERLAFSDPMTGIYNYRYFKKKLEEEFNRAKRYSKPLSIIIIDIDFFKFFNDNYGHQQGDLVLKEVADILKKKVRTVDTVARYGGEEFVIILYETDIKHAVKIAERIRKTVETTEFENRVNKGETLRITISVGVASLNDDVKSISDFIDYADACLYKAKNSGRNRVCYYDGEKYGQV